MATKRLIAAGAAVVFAGLLGCKALAPPPSPSGRADCRGGNCKIDVHIEVCAITAPNIDVYGENNIFWELDQASKDNGYHFPELIEHHGVWIKDDPKHQFDQPERVNDWKFKLHDKNDKDGKGTFNYGVQLVKGSIVCPDLDPTIVNH
jgi:hypothetical protein